MIDSFKCDNAWASNMFSCPVRVGNVAYSCSETAYQIEKFMDPEIRSLFLNLNGYEAKNLAKELKAKVRPDWQEISLSVMTAVIHAKFTQNKDLRIKLVNTYPQELVEGNTWGDTFWGVCKGIGSNWLGRILMADRVFWLDLMSNKDMYKNDARVRDYEQAQRKEVRRADDPEPRSQMAPA